MSNLLLFFFVYIFEMLISYIVFSSVSSRKYHISIILAFGFLIFEGGAVFNYLFANTIWVNLIYTLLSTYLFAVIFFRIQHRPAIVYVILMSIFSAAFEFATIFAASVIYGAEITDYNSNLPLMLIEASVSKTLYLIACVLLAYFSRSRSSLDKIPRSFYFFPFCVLLSLISFWYICANETLSETNQLLLSITSIVLLSSMVLLFINYLHSAERENEYIKVKSENDRLQIEKVHYDILEKQNQQLMIYAHDAKNHLAAIQNLSTDPRINEYVQKLSKQLKTYANSCHSGNIMLDVIIDKYAAECKIRGVEFSYDVRLCNLNDIEDIDIVSILSNLLDNAVASAEQSTAKRLSLETTNRNTYSVIVISNSCNIKPASLGEQLLTTKEDQKLHGFGLKSVGKTLKKYNGDFSWEFNDNNKAFIVTVMIPKQK